MESSYGCARGKHKLVYIYISKILNNDPVFFWNIISCYYILNRVFTKTPKARKIKRCMNKRDDCLSHEVLVSSYKEHRFNLDEFPNNQTDIFMREEVTQQPEGENANNINTDRLLINPEFAESMDLSDGSEMLAQKIVKLKKKQQA